MANTGLYNSMGKLTRRPPNILQALVYELGEPSTLSEKIKRLEDELDVKIKVINNGGAEVANLRTNKTSGRLGTYYLVYNQTTGFTPGKKPGPSPRARRVASLTAAIIEGIPRKAVNSPRARRAASLAAAIIEGIPKTFDRTRGPSEGWEAAGTLQFLGRPIGVALYRKKSGGVQKYTRVKGTENYVYKYKGWKIIGDELVWVGDKLSVKSDSVARAIAEAAIRTPEVLGHVKANGERAGLLARLFSRGASPAAVRSVQRSARVANAIRNALTAPRAGGAARKPILPVITNALRNAFKGRRRNPAATPTPGETPVAGGQPSNGTPVAGGQKPNGKPASSYLVFTNTNKTVLDLDATFDQFYARKQLPETYPDDGVIDFFNELIKYISSKERTQPKNQLDEMFKKVLTRLDTHLNAISTGMRSRNKNNRPGRFSYYEQHLKYEEAKVVARKYIKKHPETKPPGTPAAPPKPGLSFPSLFGGRNNIGSAINYANRQEREYRGYGGAPAPPSLFNTRRAASSAGMGGAPPPPEALRFPALPAEQRAAIAAQATRNLTPNQKRVVNTAGGAQLVANIVAKAGGANKVKQAATALQTYSKNNAVRMGLTTNIAVNAVNKLGGPMNAITAAAITNKIVAAMNQKVVANRAAVKRKQKRKSKPKPKPAPEPSPIRARLLKAMVKKFTKNELVRIAGENALGSKNNKTKNSLVKNFTKFMRRQPKGGKKGGPRFSGGKKGSVTNQGPKKTKK